MVYSPKAVKITIVVPLYNKAATIQRSLASIQAQTESSWEAIIVDDGSTDSSAQQVEAFLENCGDSRFRFIRQDNQGPGAARNRGLIEARSPLIALLDSDDDWLPHYLERGLAKLESSDSSVALHVQGWFDQPGGKSCIPTMRDLGIEDGVHVLSASTSPVFLVALMALFWPCTTMVRRDLAIHYGGFREQRCLYAEDVHLWLKIALNHPFSIDLCEAANFRRDASNLSGNYRGVRPIEPFLLDPEDVRRHCPEQLRPLLEDFLTIRALKTACVLSYWGQWREAVQLRQRFLSPRAAHLPWFYRSLLAASPLGALVGKFLRGIR
ncbi:MAG: glycosyltransferase family 2 protein [Bryobacter sp.]|nr:glycosyltransferase family 2 protein [Bryobacter sp. CoA8 C33]